MHSALELYRLITTELSSLENATVNHSILSYESEAPEMNTEELHDTAEELIWMAEEVAEDQTQDFDEDDDDFDEEVSSNETIEAAKNYLKQLFEMI